MSACSAENSLRALCDAASDGEPEVREQVGRSLRSLAARRPELVLETCHGYLSRRGQLEDAHRSVLLRGMEAVVRDAGGHIHDLLAKKIISAAGQELARPGQDQDFPAASKEAASDLLVALGGAFPEDVLEEMLGSLGSKSPPDLFTIRTVGRLSVANASGTMPYMASILEALMPLLNRALPNKMKAAVASAFGSLFRSILTYQDRLPDPTLRKEAFSREIQAAHHVFFNVWMQQKDSNLRMEVLSALGDTAQVMAGERLQEELPRLVPGLLACYKKRSEAPGVTRCLYRVLRAAGESGGKALEAEVEALLPPLLQQACGASEAGSELLGCWAVTVRVSPDAVLRFLDHKLAANERSRVGALSVLRHLVSTCPAELEGREAAVLASVKPALSDPDRRVRTASLEAAEALVAGGYLEAEGGNAVVEFVVAQCSLPLSEAGEEEQRTKAESLLTRAAATEGLERVLWPALLGYITLVRYTDGLTALCRALELMNSRRRKTAAEDSTLDSQPGLPSPQALLARLLAAASWPHDGRGRGAPALRLLLGLAPSIHPALQGTWSEELPDLTRFVAETSADTFPQQQWEKSLLLLLHKSMEAVSDAGWSCRLIEETGALIRAWRAVAAPQPLAPREKQFLYKCVGILLQHTDSSTVIDQQLREILLAVRHQEAVEREGVAIGVGLCARTHLDKTLGQLDDFVQWKKSAGLFGALMERLDGDVEKMKSTLILCYGYVALYAPEDLLLARVDSVLLHHVVNLSNTQVLGVRIESKDLEIKLSLIKAVTLIAKALLAHKHGHSFALARKGELLTHLQNLIKAEPRSRLTTPVRQLAMTACTFLLRLGPPLNKAYVPELIKTCLDSVVGLQAGTGVLGAAEEKVGDAAYQETQSALQDLLSEILLREPSPDGLHAIFKHVEGWVISPKEQERERAMDVTRRLLALYLEKGSGRRQAEFGHAGSMLGRLTPRLADPAPRVRASAMASVCALLHIQLRCGAAPEGRPVELVERLKAAGARLHRPDGPLLLQLCTDLAKAACEHLPRRQIGPLLFALFEGLDDHFPGCSGAASAVMNAAVPSCGSALRGQVSDMLKALSVRLQWTAGERVRLSILHFICVLAAHNTAEAVSCLLCSPLPFDANTRRIWRSLAGDTGLAAAVIHLLLDALDERLSPEATGRGAAVCPALEPLSVVCALREMLSNRECAAAVSGLYPRLFCALLLNLGASVRAHPKACTVSPDARSCSAEALRALLGTGGTAAVASRLQEAGGWSALMDPERHHQGVAALAGAVASHAGAHLTLIVHLVSGLLPRLAAGSEQPTLVAFLAELPGHPVASDLHLTDALVESLLGYLQEPAAAAARVLALRGLANVARGPGQQVELCSAKVLGALISAVSDAHDPLHAVKLEAMAGLSRLLPLLQDTHLRGLLGPALAAAQPLFESLDHRVRAAAFDLLGGLSRFGQGDLGPVYAEQVHASLVSLVLHARDGSPVVTRACTEALSKAAPLLGCDLIRAEPARAEYLSFLHNLSEAVASHFPAKVHVYLAAGVTFFKSLQPEIRANAVTFTACLLHRLPSEGHQAVAEMVAMLQDPVSSVRVSAAEALSFLH